MKYHHHLAHPGLEAAMANPDSQSQTNPARWLPWPQWHLIGPPIKRLLGIGILACALNAFAGNPVATDVGRFIKVVGKQVVSTEVLDDDIAYISKIAIVRFESTKQIVCITLSSGNMTYSFDTKEAAKAFLEQVAVFTAKDR